MQKCLEKMLAIFHKTFTHPPLELNSPESASSIPPKPGHRCRYPKNPEEILYDFHSAHLCDSLCATFGGGALVCFGPRPKLPPLEVVL
ncbi:hypothetical protein Cni_G13847 [Canna indica]|uniref:Uncharacterized protein n=1 Tax=Canna indica TaxID=4628 RepID=A0AAQ3KAM9_9LILI|nr:hypothetical protein Cni_G13847 [Canna indica]